MNQKATIATLVVVVFVLLVFVEARSKHATGAKSRLAKCEADECELSASHYALYASIKRAIDSQFDLKPKEIYPLINSVKVLELRFAEQTGAQLNGTGLVRQLLANDTLGRALRVFGSAEGQALIDLFRAPTNGKEQNLACSKFKIDDIERAAKRLASDTELASVFANINKQFVRKSAKKCLSKSCNSIDLAMSRLDYMLGKYRAPIEVVVPTAEPNFGSTTIGSTTTTTTEREIEACEKPASGYKREFADQELELCKFFKRSNESQCSISGAELREIGQLFEREQAEAAPGATGAPATSDNNKQISPVSDYLRSYVEFKQLAAVNQTESGTKLDKSEALDGLQLILDQCRPMLRLLDYNLAGVQWYAKQNANDEGKLYSRLAWCPKLSYWYHLHRLCGHLERLATETSAVSYSY